MNLSRRSCLPQSNVKKLGPKRRPTKGSRHSLHPLRSPNMVESQVEPDLAVPNIQMMFSGLTPAPRPKVEPRRSLRLDIDSLSHSYDPPWMLPANKARLSMP